MTKKDYILIADAIKRANHLIDIDGYFNDYEKDQQKKGVKTLFTVLITKLEFDNPRFSPDKFNDYINK